MYSTEVKIRVRYSETDRMGFCYYGNYAQYFEVARVEALRKLGISYKSLEDGGVLLPVRNFNIEYFSPASYDDELVIKTTVKEMPTVKLGFYYETFLNNNNINTAFTSLIFVDAETKKPIKPSQEITSLFKPYFS